jgi:hypothetical protein
MASGRFGRCAEAGGALVVVVAVAVAAAADAPAPACCCCRLRVLGAVPPAVVALLFAPPGVGPLEFEPRSEEKRRFLLATLSAAAEGARDTTTEAEGREAKPVAAAAAAAEAASALDLSALAALDAAMPAT